MTQIAVYGKGGIGKSTITANLSAALVEKGYRVLQIGCDPKHDSTRLLLHGFVQTTVLDQLKTKPPEAIRIDDIMLSGYKGVSCIEAGGPEPGVGCAGRGIISMASLLERIGLKREEFDFVIYDVLGDVVCGGFGVPMRDGYADRIFVVTSGEMMSLYAANNICKGVRNAGQRQGKLAGIIGNSRNIENEELLIRQFASQVGSRVVQFLPRHEIFRDCELRSQTVMEYAPHCEAAEWFRELAEAVLASQTVIPTPLSEEELESMLAGFYRQTGNAKPVVPVSPTPAAEVSKPDSQQLGRYFKRPEPGSLSAYLSKSVRHKEPLRSCALQGAFNVTSQVLDGISIMHSSINCSHIGFHAMLSVSKMRRLGEKDAAPAIPRLFSSNMGETEMVFGGEELLARCTAALTDQLKPKAVFLINSCPAAIIGDNPEKIARQYGNPGCPVVTVKSDGVNEGDYAQGMLNAYIAVAEALIDPTVKPEKNLVNLVGEKNASTRVEKNYLEVSRLLSALGLQVNCRFVRKTCVDQIRQFGRAPFSVLTETDDTARTLQQFLEDCFSVNFIAAAPPIGFQETRTWIGQVAAAYGKQNLAGSLTNEISEEYGRSLEELRPLLKNKQVLIFTYLQELDWLLETVLDLGMRVEKLCLFNSCVKESFSSRFSGFPVEINYPGPQRDRDIEECRPDLVLCNYLPPRMIDGVAYSLIPLCPPIGWSAGIDQAHSWIRQMRIPFVEGWRYDQKLFASLS